MNNKLRDLAQKAKKNRLNEQSRIIGYCFENAEEMSRQLYINNIEHELYYVGIINDVIQNSNANFDECIKANKENIYDNVPETKDELPDAANHYTIVVESNNNKLIVEPCSELRDDHFRDVYVGRWPHKDYLKLKDSRMNKKSKFNHYRSN